MVTLQKAAYPLPRVALPSLRARLRHRTQRTSSEDDTSCRLVRVTSCNRRAAAVHCGSGRLRWREVLSGRAAVPPLASQTWTREKEKNRTWTRINILRTVIRISMKFRKHFKPISRILTIWNLVYIHVLFTLFLFTQWNRISCSAYIFYKCDLFHD